MLLRAGVVDSARQRQTWRGLSGSGFAALVLSLAALPVRADIFQWAWKSPQDPSQGKRQGQALCPDGRGVVARANANLASRDLTQAYLWGADLTGANCSNTNFSGAFMGIRSTIWQPDDATTKLIDANLTGAKPTGADLRWVDLTRASLTNADFTDATITGTVFTNTDLTAAQVCSTANYKAGNLARVYFQGNDLTGVNLANQDLTTTFFFRVNLTGANLSGANLSGTDTPDYARTVNANLTNANLTGANLTGRSLWGTLTNANFTDAQIAQASLPEITAAQLYSTASYKQRQLNGIYLGQQDMTGWNLANQDLRTAYLSGAKLINANLAGANLAGAKLTQASLSDAKLTNANLSQADFTLAILVNASLRGADLEGAVFERNTGNMLGMDLRGARGLTAEQLSSIGEQCAILPDGTLNNLSLKKGRTLLIADYRDPSGKPTTPIRMRQAVAMNTISTTGFVIVGDTFDSTISFDPGIPVALGGTLKLEIAPDVDAAALVGHTFQLFDWTGVEPTGGFNIPSDCELVWHTDSLLTQGTVTLVAVPEPASLALLALGGLGLLSRRRVR